ncbi:zinc-finger binding domain of transposase IS66 [Fulvimarina manganoxydans]|uniref:Zinc-finger binding domain of transposase IS66 n=1 Tax=Fulvimarina manganoxydans TaxID=937218 RepID=A0A1W2EQZ8_9HYPH|nr:zinc-finger binding domain of transposase IS66 [Fulvimarina manganoxydans]
MSDRFDRLFEHRPGECPCCRGALSQALPAKTASEHETVDLAEAHPIIERHRRLSVVCPSCGTKVTAPMPEAARGTPFGPCLHAVATYLKTFQALSYERLQRVFADLFRLSISQGGLMNMLRRAQTRLAQGRDDAISALRQAKVVASDETGVRIEGTNAYQWVFCSAEAVVHRAAMTRGAVAIRETMNGHRPKVWCSDRYSAQQHHADAQQTRLAHLARAIQHKFRRARDQLLTFADWPDAVEATNNACERALRPAVIQRKVTNGYRALWAAEGEAGIRTVVDTARLRSSANP